MEPLLCIEMQSSFDDFNRAMREATRIATFRRQVFISLFLLAASAYTVWYYWRASRTFGIAFGLGYIVLISLLRMRSSYRIRKRFWDTTPVSRELRRVTIADEWFGEQSASSIIWRRWSVFTHYRETKANFLLFVGNYSFHMMQKNALADESQLQTCRQIFRSRIGNTRYVSPPSGFPVVDIPVAAPVAQDVPNGKSSPQQASDVSAKVDGPGGDEAAGMP